jgi:hypothetical protein
MVGCKKWIEVDPTEPLAEEAIRSGDDLRKLVNSCYDVLGNVFDGNIQNTAEMLSDNLARPITNNDFIAIYERDVNFFTGFTNTLYADLYRAVYRANTAIESVDFVSNITDNEKQKIIAESRFIRAICHYWALKLWAQPWGYTSDNSHLGIVIRDEASPFPKTRSTVADCYEFIIEDLQFAVENLPSSNPGYADIYSAAALLTQVLFQKMDYQGAINYANEVINSGRFTLLDNLDTYQAFSPEAYLTANTETVFGIFSSQVNGFVDIRNEGFRNNYWPGAAGAQLSYSPELNNFLNLSPTDARIDAWTSQEGGQIVSKRFGSNATESFFFSIPIIRLTHIHLIRAEAIAMVNGDLSVAIEDINAIRDRAFGVGLNDMPSGATAQQIILAARDEFRKETISEGYRIDQIKRIGASGENILVRGAPWNCPGMAIQFPNSEFTGASFVGNPEGGC